MAIAESQPDRRKLPSRRWVVLLVDDEPDVLATLRTLLETSLDGLIVLTAGSGREGLKVLETERVDAVISDFKMAGMDGIEFLYLARRLRPNVPRVMLSAYGDSKLMARAIHEGGVKGFVSKAANPDQFVAQVAGILTYAPTIVPGP